MKGCFHLLAASNYKKMEEEIFSNQEQSSVEMSSLNQKEEIGERKLSIEDAFTSSWNSFKNNKKILLTVTLIYIGVVIFESILQNILSEKFIVQLAINIVSMVVNIVVMIGLIKIFLKISRNENAAISDLFDGKRYFLKLLGGYILYVLIILVGFLLFIIPGLIWQIKYSYFTFLIIDKDMNPIEALKESGKITYGFKWKLFFLLFVAGFVCLVGLLFFGVGIFIAYPVSLLMVAYAYRVLIGEKILTINNNI